MGTRLIRLNPDPDNLFRNRSGGGLPHWSYTRPSYGCSASTGIEGYLYLFLFRPGIRIGCDLLQEGDNHPDLHTDCPDNLLRYRISDRCNYHAQKLPFYQKP